MDERVRCCHGHFVEVHKVAIHNGVEGTLCIECCARLKIPYTHPVTGDSVSFGPKEGLFPGIGGTRTHSGLRRGGGDAQARIYSVHGVISKVMRRPSMRGANGH